MDLGHWICSQDFDPDEWWGFVYRVTNIQTDMQYIGRKQFRSAVTKPPLKGKKRKRKSTKDSGWREYTTSSRMINEEIKIIGKDAFIFEIIELCRTKGELSYREVEIQWEEKVLSATLPSGKRKYYNGNIGAIKFRLSKDLMEDIKQRNLPK